MFNNDFAENREGEVKDTDSSVANPSQGAPSDFDTSESEDMDERSQHISQQYYDRYKQVTEPKYLYIFFVRLKEQKQTTLFNSHCERANENIGDA
jgi:hypothetical protein